MSSDSEYKYDFQKITNLLLLQRLITMTQPVEKRNIEFVGIDIAKNKLDVCLGNDNKKSSLSNSSQGFKQLNKLLPEPAGCIIVLEPTGGYEKEVIVYLQKNSYSVVLANALKVRRYAEAMGFLAKNDPIDSYVIKSFGEDLYPKGKLVVLIGKSDAFRKLEMWLNRSRQLVKLITSEKNRIVMCPKYIAVLSQFSKQQVYFF